jgi:tetratricopeptide (TPR) repeat protein
VLSVFGGGAPRALFPKALAAATRALELDPELAEAHAELGHIQMVYDLDLAAAEKSLLRALEVNPKSAMAHHYMGLLHISRGSLDAALASVRRAQALEPLALNFNANIGMIHYYARRYEEAVTQLQTTLGMDARFDHARSLLGRAYLRLGRPDLAIREFESRWSTTIGSRADLPMAYALSGRSAEAVAVLEQLRAEATTVFVSSFDIATVYAALGNMGEAFEWLERAIEQRVQPINFLGVDPAFDVLRADRRFATLVRRLSG